MAKLEELVTPTELLSAIKEGAVKQEIVKKYRASEQELAMMLLPLYRNGDLTKQEFNDFFKGVSLRKPEEGEEAVAPPKTEDEPPSEILKSLSKIFGKRSQEEKQASVEEEPPPSSPAPEPEEITAPAQDVATEVVPEGASEVVAEPVAEPEDLFQPEVVEEPVPETHEDYGEAVDFSTDEEPVSVASTIEPPADVEAEAAEVQAVSSTGMDSADISGLLNSIFAKLNSIDKRLEAIEQKVLSE